MSHEYVYKMSSRYLQKWLRYSIKHVKNRHFSRHCGTLPWFSEFYFLTDFDASKSVLGSFFAFFAKIWTINMYRSSKSRISFVWPFSPGDLRCHQCHQWPESHQWPPGQISDLIRVVHVQGYQMAFENLEIGPVVWEISGGGGPLPPPSRTCYYPDPSGARVN